MILYITSKLIKKIGTYYKIFLSDNINSKIFYIVSAVLIATFTFFYWNINWNNSLIPSDLFEANARIFIAYGVIMIIIFFILFFFLKEEANIKYKQMQLDNLKEYTDNVENLYNDMRKFRHDYINIISTMSWFIDNDDMVGLKKHFDENIYPLNKKINKNNYKLGFLQNMCLPEIKGLISGKIIHAQELGLNIFIDITEPIEEIEMDIIDLSRILGILIDNAIEAAIKSEDKLFNLGFVKKGNSVIIVLTNSFEGEIPPISKLFTEGFSTKGERRGVGLSNLKEIIGRCKNVLIDTSINANNFFQEININSAVKKKISN